MTILQPVLQPVLRPLLADPLAPGFGDGLSAAVKALFASGEKGVMFDLVNAANLYTDSARTTLVSASGDGIGSATDLSGNGKHASSAGSARPTWNSAGYATFDAFDDYLQTAAIDFSATDAVTVVACIRKSTDAAAGVVAELGPVYTTAGGFLLLAPGSAGQATVLYGSSGSVGSTFGNATGQTAPLTLVATGESKISADQCALRINGAAAASSSTDQGSGNYRNAVLNIGARNGGASTFLNGRIYRLLVIGRALTTTERNTAERWAAQPVGISIP
jgi:hypothetical protein